LSSIFNEIKIEGVKLAGIAFFRPIRFLPSGQQVGGVQFSKRYQYLYTNISGFACLALAGTPNPFTEQLRFSESRMVMPQ